jgi:hypothetical protein
MKTHFRLLTKNKFKKYPVNKNQGWETHSTKVHGK